MALQTAPERTGVATFKGNPLTLIGNEVKVGDKAPNFEVQKNLLETATLDSFAGKIKLISVVPSLDTGVCDIQTRRFNAEASNLGENVVILTVSVDLPFAQSRWCGAAGATQVVAYGVYIKEFGLLMRSIFVVDADNNVAYVEYLPEMTSEPNYDAAIAAVKAIIG
jgi:thioredoxin-dependent peroxiredoxin